MNQRNWEKESVNETILERRVGRFELAILCLRSPADAPAFA
jgi:hypothetical protein